MHPSTWNDTNQHWIPQFLLKGFGIRRRASSVYRLDKHTKAVAVRKVDEVASKSRLLTERDDELVRKTENRATEAVDEIRKGHLNRVGESERQAVNRLVCTMMLNDPYSGPDAEAKRENVIDEAISELSKAVNRYGDTLDEPDVRNFFDKQLGHDWLSGFMDSRSNQIAIALSLMGLRAYRPTDGEFFIIGDSPVLVVPNAANGKASLGDPDSQVILPIHSRCMLVYAWTTEMNVIDDGGTLDREQVRSLNSDYCHGTECRYIYGRDEETLRRSRLLPLTWTPRKRSNDVKKGWSMMLYLQQIRQRQMAAQDAVRDRLRENATRELVEVAIAKPGRATSPTDQRP